MAITKAKSTNSLRVIAGQWRSRRLHFPDLDGLRPTADRVRETLFNWLQERIAYARCLDLFAGSGACGIEALSRGAQFVRFVDVSPLATRALRANLELLGARNYDVLCEDSLTWIASRSVHEEAGYDVIFLDPPFGTDLLLRCARALENSALLKTDGLIYIENAEEVPNAVLPKSWRMLKSKRAGAVYFYLFQQQSKGGAVDE